MLAFDWFLLQDDIPQICRERAGTLRGRPEAILAIVTLTANFPIPILYETSIFGMVTTLEYSNVCLPRVSLLSAECNLNVYCSAVCVLPMSLLLAMSLLLGLSLFRL